MLRSRRSPKCPTSASEPRESETGTTSARSWGKFSVLKLINELKDLYSAPQAKSTTSTAVEQHARKPSVPKAPTLSNRRADETDGVYFRSNRLFTANHDWYFATREGENKGPFQNRQQAELALAAFIAQCLSEEIGKPVVPTKGDHMAELDEMVDEAQDVIRILKRQGHTGAIAWAHKRIRALKQKGHRTRHPSRRIEVIEHILHSV